MPDPHMPDCVIESYHEETNSLAATVARMQRENRELREENARLRGELADATDRLTRHRDYRRDNA